MAKKISAEWQEKKNHKKELGDASNFACFHNKYTLIIKLTFQNRDMKSLEGKGGGWVGCGHLYHHLF